MMNNVLAEALAALNNGDFATASGYFASDAILRSDHGHTYEGPKAIRDALSRRFANADPEFKIGNQVCSESLGPELLLLEADIMDRGKPRRWTSIAKKTDGAWQVHRLWVIPSV